MDANKCEVVSYSLSGVLGARNKSCVHPPASALPPAGKRCANPILDLIPLISLFLTPARLFTYFFVYSFRSMDFDTHILLCGQKERKEENRCRRDVELIQMYELSIIQK